MGRRGNPLIWKYKLLNLRRVTILWMDKKGTGNDGDGGGPVVKASLSMHTHTYNVYLSFIVSLPSPSSLFAH